MDKQQFETNHPDAILVLDVFRQFLNAWFEDDRKRMTPADRETVPDIQLEDFFKYDETAVISQVALPRWSASDHIIMQAGYGDDGGPSILYAVVEREDDSHFQVIHVVQEFDTNFMVIYDRTPDGKHFGLRGTPDLINAVPA